MRVIEQWGGIPAALLGWAMRVFDLETIGLYGKPVCFGYYDGKKLEQYPKYKKVDGFIGHNAKYELKVLMMYNMLSNLQLRDIQVEDLLSLAKIVVPTLYSYELSELAWHLLGKKRAKDECIEASEKELWERNKECLVLIYELYKKLIKDLDQPAVYQLENELQKVVAEMELFGIQVDNVRMAAIKERVEKEKERVIKKLRKVFGDIDFDSPKQLREVLYDKMGMKAPRLTPKGSPSTDKAALEELGERYDEVKPLLRYRQLEKLLTTYLGLRGEIHCSFNSLGASTGRFSSSGPNMQNIPRNDEFDIRSAFVPRDGYLFCVGDYSQIEVRLMAHLSQDELLIKLFRQGGDIYKQMSKVFKLSRDDTKTLVLAMQYGMSPQSLASRLEVSLKDGERIYSDYFHKFRGISAFQNAVYDFWNKNGYVKTIIGRKRYLGREAGYSRIRRQCANTVVQGTAAEVIKAAMVDVFYDEELAGKVRLLLTVHDELVFEVPKKGADKYANRIQQIMKAVGEKFKLLVPLEVKVGVGDSWRAAKS